MPNSGYPLDAYLIFDNCSIVGLCEFYCDMYHDLPFTDMIQKACQELSGVFATLRRFALSGTLLTTNNILGEFLPERSELKNYRGFSKNECDCLKAHLRTEIEAEQVNEGMINRLREFKQTPSRFGAGLSRISDNDLSLVVLALGFARHTHERVYILTDEEDLRSFVSWMKARPEAKSICADSEKVDALHSLVYMDTAHRQCAFPTDLIKTMLTYHSIQQMSRTMLYGTTKGEMITDTFKKIFEAICESGKIKQQTARGLAL